MLITSGKGFFDRPEKKRKAGMSGPSPKGGEERPEPENLSG